MTYDVYYNRLSYYYYLAWAKAVSFSSKKFFNFLSDKKHHWRHWQLSSNPWKTMKRRTFRHYWSFHGIIRKSAVNLPINKSPNKSIITQSIPHNAIKVQPMYVLYHLDWINQRETEYLVGGRIVKTKSFAGKGKTYGE